MRDREEDAPAPSVEDEPIIRLRIDGGYVYADFLRLNNLPDGTLLYARNGPKEKVAFEQFLKMKQKNPEIDALKEEIELCHRKLEGLDEIIDKLKAENERLRSALKGLLSDTQHVEHEDCEYSPCPVRTARQILKETKWK